MAMLLTSDERLVLRHLDSGKSIEEIAVTLNWPIQAVRWTCTHPLITWVLDELEPHTTRPGSRPAREVTQGREIVDYLWASPNDGLVVRRWPTMPQCPGSATLMPWTWTSCPHAMQSKTNSLRPRSSRPSSSGVRAAPSLPRS